mmetsp:Transcript_6460/g.9517  ORF Transcript_6460/g.9517 Transcript_6460/m.9517 type:complete len:95 (+) Transcript_6460:53-337(+)
MMRNNSRLTYADTPGKEPKTPRSRSFFLYDHSRRSNSSMSDDSEKEESEMPSSPISILLSKAREEIFEKEVAPCAQEIETNLSKATQIMVELTL